MSPSIPHDFPSLGEVVLPPVNLEEMENFFRKFEILCRGGKRALIAISILTVAGAYYAYLQRAYLMLICGIAQCLFQSFLINELGVLQAGSRKIHSLAKQENSGNSLVAEFQNMARQSYLFSRMRLQKANANEIHQAVVIPFDAILKLIPSWRVA